VPTLHGISHEHYAMHETQLFLTSQVYPMLMSSVPMHGAHSTEKVPFLNWLYNFFWRALFSCFGMILCI